MDILRTIDNRDGDERLALLEAARRELHRLKPRARVLQLFSKPKREATRIEARTI